MIPFAQNAANRDVQRVGAVEREHHPMRIAAVEERRELRANIVQFSLGRNRHAMPGAPGIRRILGQKTNHFFLHTSRLGPARGAVIQVGNLTHLVSRLFQQLMKRRHFDLRRPYPGIR
jgi:hypothetical protein